MKYDDATRRARRKAAWEMRYEKKLTWVEIGAALGVSEARARQLARLHRQSQDAAKENVDG